MTEMRGSGTPTEAYGSTSLRRCGRSMAAEARIGNEDGRLHQVRAAGPTVTAVRHRLRERVPDQPGLAESNAMQRSRIFADLTTFRFTHLKTRELSQTGADAGRVPSSTSGPVPAPTPPVGLPTTSSTPDSSTAITPTGDGSSAR